MIFGIVFFCDRIKYAPMTGAETTITLIDHTDVSVRKIEKKLAMRKFISDRWVTISTVTVSVTQSQS